MITKSSSENRRKSSIALRATAMTMAAAFTFSASAFAFNDTVKTTVIDGENSVSISSKTKDPNEIIKLAGVNMGAYDELDLSGFTEKDGGEITVNRAKILRINDNGKIGYFVGYSDTVGNLFKDRGIVMNDGDTIDIDTEENIFDGMRLMIKRAFSVSIESDGETRKLAIAEGTVSDALEKAEIKLGENDTVTPALDTKLNGLTKIKVTRVSYKIAIETQPVSYGVDIIYDDSMYAGETKKVSDGIDGVKEVYHSEKYVDGELAESVVQKEVVTKEPVNEVKRVGTKSRDDLSLYRNTVSPISELDIPSEVKVDSNGVPVNFKYKVEGRATAYTGDPATASGRKPMAGHVAVDPNEYPYGTELYITSADGAYVYGYCIAADTGGFVEMGNADIDLYMNTEEMCYDWGNRPITVYVL